MSRKKVVKSAARKKQTSKQATKSPANALLKMEMDFSQAPAKLAEQLTKEIAALKQKENKLSTTLTKIQAQANKLEKNMAAAKKLGTAAGKKQLLAAKKALNDTKKDYSLSNAALKDTAKAIADAALKLARANALAKHLKAFEKEWAKQAKALKDKAKATAAKKPKSKAKAKAKTTTRRKAAQAAAPALTVIEQPEFNSYEDAADEAQYDDAKQANS